MTQSSEQLLMQAYVAFNARNIDAALSLMCSEVEWPNGMEGGIVHGHSGVREYWTRQWGMINPTVEPLSIRTEADGRFDVGTPTGAANARNNSPRNPASTDRHHRCQ